MNKNYVKYKFEKSLCDLLNIDHSNYYYIKDIVDIIIPNVYKKKSKFKFDNENIANYFNKNIGNYIWLSELNNIINNKIIDKDKQFINKYLIIGYNNDNIDYNINVDLI